MVTCTFACPLNGRMFNGNSFEGREKIFGYILCGPFLGGRRRRRKKAKKGKVCRRGRRKKAKKWKVQERRKEEGEEGEGPSHFNFGSKSGVLALTFFLV